ncbi:hypothetical protein KSD_49600 [Ktedonobacter sp. SOSP1-85]|nr:hypothetical protein KSD_49600 [Ktedonobacter sp. SOSP1-85]
MSASLLETPGMSMILLIGSCMSLYSRRVDLLWNRVLRINAHFFGSLMSIADQSGQNWDGIGAEHIRFGTNMGQKWNSKKKGKEKGKQMQRSVIYFGQKKKQGVFLMNDVNGIREQGWIHNVR